MTPEEMEEVKKRHFLERRAVPIGQTLEQHRVEGERLWAEKKAREQALDSVAAEARSGAQTAAFEIPRTRQAVADHSREVEVRQSLGMSSKAKPESESPPEVSEQSAEGGKYLNVPEAAKQLGEWVDKELINYFSKAEVPEPKKLGYVPLEPEEQQLLKTVKTEFLKAAQQARGGDFSVRTFVFRHMPPEAFENYETLTFKAKSRTLHGEMWQSLSEGEKKGFPERQKQAAEIFSLMQRGQEFLDFSLTDAEQELINKARFIAETQKGKLSKGDKVVYENLVQRVAFLLTKTPSAVEFFDGKDQLIYENFVQNNAYKLTKETQLRDKTFVPEKLTEERETVQKTPGPAVERSQKKAEGASWERIERASEQEAIGDLNGSYKSFVAHLQARGLIEVRGEAIEWKGGNKRVVFVGDILGDRNPTGLKVMESLARLNAEAQKQGGSVESLAGNHDNMFTAVLGGFDTEGGAKPETDYRIFIYRGTLEGAFYTNDDFKKYVISRFNEFYNGEKLNLEGSIRKRAKNLEDQKRNRANAATVKSFEDYLAEAEKSLAKLEDIQTNVTPDDEGRFMAMLTYLPQADAVVIGQALVRSREAVLANMKTSPQGRARLEAVCSQKLATFLDDTLYTHTNMTGEMVQDLLKGRTIEEGIEAVNNLYQKGLRHYLLGEGQLSAEERKQFDELRNRFISTTDESRINFTEDSNLSPADKQRMEDELKKKGVNLVVHGHNDEGGRVLGTANLPIVSIDRSVYKGDEGKGDAPIATLTIDRKGNVKSAEAKQTVRERTPGNSTTSASEQTGKKSQVEISGKNENQERSENKLDLVTASLLETIQKYDLAQLLVSEQRKATHLGNAVVIESEEHRKQLEREFGEEYRTTAELLTKLGLPFEGEPPHEDNGIYRFSFVVAKDTENLTKAVEADKTNNDKEFGALMGYPKTAVDAYQTENAFDLRTELPKEELEELEEEEVLAFLEFMPSKGHWREELDEVRTIQKLIKEQSPELYDEIIEWRKKEAQESREYDIPADAEMLVEYAKTHFGRFAESDTRSFKELWTADEQNHFKQYMDVSIRTMLKDASGAEVGEDRVKDLCRTTEEKIILQRLLAESGGSAVPLEEFDKQPFSKVVREALGINVEEAEGGYYKHFMKK
jgi:hypothetical protein